MRVRFRLPGLLVAATVLTLGCGAPSSSGSNPSQGAMDAGADTDASTTGPGDGPGTGDGGGDNGAAPDAGDSGSSGGDPTWWHPVAGATFQWDLSGSITNLDVAADVYDIDAFENSAETVRQLHQKGKKVICYISVGTLEPGRPDEADFKDADKGKYWPDWGEYYVDIRSDSVRDIMKKRLDMCKSKGFDGIEPDNMDMFEADMTETGFALTEQDGIDYARFLAREAHARGLSIGQKNASSITSAISEVFDWALSEDCFSDGWCDELLPYTQSEKPVFQCEYTDTGIDFSAVCAASKSTQFSPLLKRRDLDSWVEFCP